MLGAGVGINSAGWLLCYCIREQKSVLHELHVRVICLVIKMLQVVFLIC